MQKFYLALGGALAQAIVASADGKITLTEGLGIALAALTAAGVYKVTNQP